MRLFWIIFGIPIALALILAVLAAYVLSAFSLALSYLLDSIPEPTDKARLK